MNTIQLSGHIGNIDDNLVWQAGQISGYRHKHRKKIIKRLAGAAAAIVLMVCSFGAGVFAFSHKNAAEVHVVQENITLGGTGVNIILPGSWSGKYSMEKDGQNYRFYSKQIKEAASKEEDAFEGLLFSIVYYKEAMTPEQYVEKGYDFVGWRYLFSTSDSTYILCYASDVQWNPDIPGQEEIYTRMASEIEDIKFVVGDVLKD